VWLKNFTDDYFVFKDLYKQGYNGNVVITAVLFSFRRNIDGTRDEFFNAPGVLVQTYKSE